MQTHRDSDSNRFMERLIERAKDDRAAGRSNITGGKEGEESIAEWKARGVHVRQLPDDEQGILRISIGGSQDTSFPLNYLVFRGKQSACIELLREALIALQKGPRD
jgi:hypothetical protein